jgi:hypothetical protein
MKTILKNKIKKHLIKCKFRFSLKKLMHKRFTLKSANASLMLLFYFYAHINTNIINVYI